MTQLTGKHVVIGLGKTGLSCVRFLKRLGCNVVVIDTRSEPPGMETLKSEFRDVPLLCGELSQFKLDQAQELIVSPGVPIQTPAIAKAMCKGVPVAGDIELFARSVDAPVLAVTGSNGKSTVVSLLGAALNAVGWNVCVAGNIGLPVLDALTELPQVDVWVLELSSFQLETTHSLRARVALNLNLSEDHMDRYDSFGDYAMAKQRIFDGCDHAVYWLDDYRTRPAQGGQSMKSYGGSGEQRSRFYVADHNGQACVWDGDKPVLNEAQLKIKGQHNLLNLAAVLTVLVEFDVNYSEALPALSVFPGLPHRCQWVARIDGVDWYNDSKGTNVGSTIAAINGLVGSVQGKLIWLAGGVGKDADFSTLLQPVSKHVGLSILYGRDAQQIKDGLASVENVMVVSDLDQAVQAADQAAKPGDVVLLSPACASFDQFANYEARGEHFMQVVRRLSE